MRCGCGQVPLNGPPFRTNPKYDQGNNGQALKGCNSSGSGMLSTRSTIWLVLIWLPASNGSPRHCTNAAGVTGTCGPRFPECDATSPLQPAPRYHVQDLSCGENDPNAPAYDPQHKMYHLMYQKHVGRNGSGITFGHVASRDMVRWVRLPVAVWNGPEQYDARAIYSGSALGDVEGHGLTLVYPGVCNAGSADCLYGSTVNIAQPTNRSDPLSTNFTKREDLNPIAQVNGSVGPGGGGPPGGGGDSSAPFRTSSGEWRIITRDSINNTVWGSTDFFRARSWYRIGPQPGFTQGACPSFFPLAPASDGRAIVSNATALAPDTPTHVYLYSKTTIPLKCCSHRSVMVVGRYIDHGPKQLAEWVPSNPGTEYQIVDNGTYYAAKDFWDPVKQRRILYGWAQIQNGAQALPRVVTWSSQLKQLLFAPLPELRALRSRTALAHIEGVRLKPGRATSLGKWPRSVGNQSEVMATFGVPRTASSFGVGMMTERGAATVEVYIDFEPQTPSATVGIRNLVPNNSPTKFNPKTDATARLPLLPTDTDIQVHIFVDNVMAEVFFMGGRSVLTVELGTTEEAGFTLFARGGSVVAQQVTAWHLGSAWVSSSEVLRMPS